MEDSECSELRKLSSGVYFLAPAETHPLLHVVLSSQTSLSVSVEALQWCSEGTIIQSSRTFLESVFGGTSNLVTVTNTSTGMGFIGLRKNLPGRPHLLLEVAQVVSRGDAGPPSRGELLLGLQVGLPLCRGISPHNS